MIRTLALPTCQGAFFSLTQVFEFSVQNQTGLVIAQFQAA